MAINVNYPAILMAAGKAILIALAVNTALFLGLSSLQVIDPHFAISPDGKGITTVAVAMGTFLGMSVGTLIFLLLARFTANPARIFTWVCIAVFVLTLANPFLAGMPTGMALAVDALHVAPAYLIWRFLTRAVA